ncbi:MAG: endonuclease/exonuclease/phosphatase family protein [Pseudomonadota bacterium]
MHLELAKRNLIALAALSGLLFGLGYLGHLHPFFDALAIGRWAALYGALFFLIVIALWAGRTLVGAVLCGALALIVIIPQSSGNDTSGESSAGSVRVYTKNLWYANRETNLVVADLRAMAPDLVFLQEVSAHNKSIMDGMRATLPHQALCPWQGWNGMAILSRWPLASTAPICSPQRSVMAVLVAGEEGPFWAIGVHLQQPWPDVQWSHLEQALAKLPTFSEGAIVAGDFNTVPWSAAARKIGDITGTRPIQPIQATFHMRGIPLPLDQVWASGGRAQVRPKAGSDHHGVVADVWPSRGDPSEQ